MMTIIQNRLPDLWLDITVADLNQSKKISQKALIDTGFNGFVTIPGKTARELGLKPFDRIFIEGFPVKNVDEISCLFDF